MPVLWRFTDVTTWHLFDSDTLKLPWGLVVSLLVHHTSLIYVTHLGPCISLQHSDQHNNGFPLLIQNISGSLWQFSIVRQNYFQSERDGDLLGLWSLCQRFLLVDIFFALKHLSSNCNMLSSIAGVVSLSYMERQFDSQNLWSAKFSWFKKKGAEHSVFP